MMSATGKAGKSTKQESGKKFRECRPAARLACRTMPTFSRDEAEALVLELLPVAREIIEVRADLMAATRDVPPAPLADQKALEARLAELLDTIVVRGVEVKGWAPLLLDLPGQLDGRDVLWCWLEGEAALGWYHDVDHGFAGRRRLP